jgi:hypothetical protein
VIRRQRAIELVERFLPFLPIPARLRLRACPTINESGFRLVDMGFSRGYEYHIL